MERGDRVLLYMQNCPQFIIAYYAILRADAVVVPVNPMNRTEELRHYVEDSGARVAIAGQDVLREIEPLGPASTCCRIVYCGLPDARDRPAGARLRARAAGPRRPGRRRWRRTSQPGAASRRPRRPGGDALHLGHHRQAQGLHAHASQRAGDHRAPTCTGAARRTRAWCSRALPLFHVTGMQAGMNAPIYAGATLVVLPRWDRDCAGLLIERARVTNWSAITTMMIDFLANPNFASTTCRSLRVLGGGGAAMPEAVARKLEEVIGLPFVEGYGLTETMAPTHINPPHRPSCSASAFPFFNIDARVVDPRR